MTDTVLITGGLGYVGGRIAKFLSQNTNLNLILSTRKKDHQTPEWLNNGRIVNLDLMSDRDLEKNCMGVQSIIHLAAANEIDSSQNPESALRVNVVGTLKILQAAINQGVTKFIYFSTAHVYGAPLRGVITEKTVPRPIHPYAISHKTAEDFVLAAHDKQDILGLVIRLSNGFGAPINGDVDRWSLIVNDLCRQAVSTGKLVLKSSGLQKRDFITLKGVGEAVSHLLSLDAEKYGDGLYNLGGNCTLSIIEITERIAERCFQTLGFKPEIVRPSPKVGESSDELDFCMDKLKSVGLVLSQNINEEIDSTLLFCKDFVKK
jgi:UDP-glucose 4-epimerase